MPDGDSDETWRAWNFQRSDDGGFGGRWGRLISERADTGQVVPKRDTGSRSRLCQKSGRRGLWMFGEGAERAAGGDGGA